MSFVAIRTRLRRAAGVLGKRAATAFATHRDKKVTDRQYDPYPDSRDAADGSPSFRVADIMSSPVPIVAVGVRLAVAARALCATDCTAIAVVDNDGLVVDLVTEDSVASAYLTQVWTDAIIGGNGSRAVLPATVPNFAPRNHTVELDSSIIEVVEAMLRSGLPMLPVVHHGRPVGAIGWHDIFSCADGPESVSPHAALPLVWTMK